MSLFDYPRINFEGTLQLSPGTANNDDYAANYSMPPSYGRFAGQPLALIDSKSVEPRTYGMSDADFITWAQQVQTFDIVGQPGHTGQTIPAEWNYYGGMDSQSVTILVTGAQAGPEEAGSGPLGRPAGRGTDVLRRHHGRQLRRIAALDAVLLRPSDAVPRRHHLPQGCAE